MDSLCGGVCGMSLVLESLLSTGISAVPISPWGQTIGQQKWPVDSRDGLWASPSLAVSLLLSAFISVSGSEVVQS